MTEGGVRGDRRGVFGVTGWGLLFRILLFVILSPPLVIPSVSEETPSPAETPHCVRGDRVRTVILSEAKNPNSTLTRDPLLTLRVTGVGLMGFQQHSTLRNRRYQSLASSCAPLCHSERSEESLLTPSRDPSLTLRVTRVEPVILSEAKNPDRTLSRDPSLRSG